MNLWVIYNPYLRCSAWSTFCFSASHYTNMSSYHKPPSGHDDEQAVGCDSVEVFFTDRPKKGEEHMHKLERPHQHVPYKQFSIIRKPLLQAVTQFIRENYHKIDFSYNEKEELKKGINICGVKKMIKNKTSENKRHKEMKTFPNYFISVQICNQSVHKSLKNIQDMILEKEPKLESATINPSSFHLTLFVMHLKNDDEINKASRLLESCTDDIGNLDWSDHKLNVTGLGHFGNSVLFAKIEENESMHLLHSIYDLLEKRFTEEKFLLSDKAFKPHITIMKMSKMKYSMRKDLRKIEEKHYCEFKDNTFGESVIQGVQLCSMVKEKQENGYYHVDCELSSGFLELNSTDLINTGKGASDA